MGPHSRARPYRGLESLLFQSVNAPSLDAKESSGESSGESSTLTIDIEAGIELRNICHGELLRGDHHLDDPLNDVEGNAQRCWSGHRWHDGAGQDVEVYREVEEVDVIDEPCKRRGIENLELDIEEMQSAQMRRPVEERSCIGELRNACTEIVERPTPLERSFSNLPEGRARGTDGPTSNIKVSIKVEYAHHGYLRGGLKMVREARPRCECHLMAPTENHRSMTCVELLRDEEGKLPLSLLEEVPFDTHRPGIEDVSLKMERELPQCVTDRRRSSLCSSATTVPCNAGITLETHHHGGAPRCIRIERMDMLVPPVRSRRLRNVGWSHKWWGMGRKVHQAPIVAWTLRTNGEKPRLYASSSGPSIAQMHMSAR